MSGTQTNIEKKLEWHEELISFECAEHLSLLGFNKPCKFYYIRNAKGDVLYSNTIPTEEGVKWFRAYTLTEIKYWLPEGFVTGREIGQDPATNAFFPIYLCFTNHPLKNRLPGIQSQISEADAAGSMLHCLILNKHIDLANTRKLKDSNIILLNS